MIGKSRLFAALRRGQDPFLEKKKRKEERMPPPIAGIFEGNLWMILPYLGVWYSFLRNEEERIPHPGLPKSCGFGEGKGIVSRNKGGTIRVLGEWRKVRMD
jgi:hypothetical protein